MGAVTNGSIHGALLRMGNSVRDIDLKAGRQRPLDNYDLFQADQDVAPTLRYPTDLSIISGNRFDAIARHGYEIADSVLTAYSPNLFPHSFTWKN
jgi:NTE family protein